MPVAGAIVAMVVHIPQRLDAAGRDHHRAAVAARSHQPVDPAFEAEPVADDQARVGQLPGMVRAGLEDMDVGAGGDQAANLHRVAAHLLDDVGEQVEGRDHRQRRGCRLRLRTLRLRPQAATRQRRQQHRACTEQRAGQPRRAFMPGSAGAAGCWW